MRTLVYRFPKATDKDERKLMLRSSQNLCGASQAEGAIQADVLPNDLRGLIRTDAATAVLATRIKKGLIRVIAILYCDRYPA